MNLITINNETILTFCPYGRNRSNEMLDLHKKVYEKFNISINRIEFPFPGMSHGQSIDIFINQTIDTIKPDYYLFTEIDCIPLRSDIIEYCYNIVKNKQTLFGLSHQSNHKKSPIGEFTHPYASPAFCMFSTELYEKLNRPTADHFIDRSDTIEEYTYKCEELGYSVCLAWPTEVKQQRSLVGWRPFGGGMTYSNLCYHQSSNDLPESLELFKEKINNFIK